MQLQEDFEAVKKEVEEEIANINAAKLSSGQLVIALATTRFFLRYTQESLEIAKGLATPMSEVLSIAERALQSRERDIAIANDWQSQVIQLLPKAFQAGQKKFAKAGVTARHQENRALKQDVFTWLDANPPKPRGKDAAATAIAGGIVPVAFRTARRWIDEWEKLRATGTM